VLVLAQRAQQCGATRRISSVSCFLLVPARRAWVGGATRSLELLRVVWFLVPARRAELS
ncbi:hypothetical protein A2U01_0039867, partial [Trifolium medium]|nr:hypothetical protein [Trifolium medium]